MSAVVKASAKLDQLTALVAALAPLAGLKVHLYSNDFTPTIDTVIGDLTEANFTGYAASSVVAWGAPFIDGQGHARVAGDSKQFTQTALTVSNVIFGYYITDTAGTELIAVERFAEPIAFGAIGQAVIVLPTYAIN